MPYGGSSVFVVPTFRNAVINGDNQIAQIGTGAGVNPNFAFAFPFHNCVDNCSTNGAAPGALSGVTITDKQVADHPLLGAQGFCKQIGVSVAGVPGVNDWASVDYPVEGFNLKNLFFNQCALSFWVKTNVPGTYYVTAANAANFRRYIQPYIVQQSGVWQQFLLPLVFTGENVANWNFNNTSSLIIRFPFVAGANFQAPNNVLNRWDATGYESGQGQPNVVSALGQYFQVTDVQLEPGFIATPYDRQVFDISYQRCQRYYWQTFIYGQRPVQNVGNSLNTLSYNVHVAGIKLDSVIASYPVEMRTTPAVTFYNPRAANAKWRNNSLAADSALGNDAGGAKFLNVTNAQVAGDATGNSLAIHATSDARM